MFINVICACIFPIDVLTVGVWKTLSELQDPELRRSASALPDTVLRSRADSTTKKYLYAFQRWKVWAEARQEVSIHPVNGVHFALYLQHLAESIQSKSAVEEAVNAIGWVHQISGLPPIVQSPFFVPRWKAYEGSWPSRSRRKSLLRLRCLPH